MIELTLDLDKINKKHPDAYFEWKTSWFNNTSYSYRVRLMMMIPYFDQYGIHIEAKYFRNDPDEEHRLYLGRVLRSSDHYEIGVGLHFTSYYNAVTKCVEKSFLLRQNQLNLIKRRERARVKRALRVQVKQIKK